MKGNDFDVKCILRSYGSLNDLVAHHFNLLTIIIAEKLEKLIFFTLEVTEIVSA